MKDHPIIIIVLGLLSVGALVGMALSGITLFSFAPSDFINSFLKVFLGIFIVYLYVFCKELCTQNPNNNFKERFFITLKKYTLFSVLKEIFNDSVKENDDDNKDRLLGVLHGMLLIGFLFMVACFIINIIWHDAKLGEFGDFLGGVLNPIFTFMTFFGVIITIVLQKIELKAAREEYTKSANALGTQAIENTFFNMLSLHHKIVEKINFNATEFNYNLDFQDHPNSDNTPSLIGEKACQGAEAFSRLLSVIACGVEREDTFSLYKVVQNHHNHHFGSYFRSLYQIMKFIVQNNSVEDDDKKKYMSILRAQLSSDELIALFINCSGDMVDNGQFRAFLKKYHMLEHMPLSYHEDENKKHYKSKNFIIADIESIKEYLSNENNGALGKRDFYLPSID